MNSPAESSDACGPLEVALAAPKPITVERHEQMRGEMLAGLMHERDFDDIDLAAADPIHDHRPQAAPKHKVNRVLGLLDRINRENINRRFPTK